MEQARFEGWALDVAGTLVSRWPGSEGRARGFEDGGLKTGQMGECVACGQACHVKAKVCPRCGKPKPTKGRARKRNGWLAVGGAVVVAVAVVSWDDIGDGASGRGPEANAARPDLAEPTDAEVADPASAAGPDGSLPVVMTEEAARALAARAVTGSGRKLLGDGFGSGIARQAGGKWYFRVRAMDDAYLVVVWEGGASIKTCRQARADGQGCDAEAEWLTAAAPTGGTRAPARRSEAGRWDQVGAPGGCHLEAMDRARRSSADADVVVDRMREGNGHLASATACGDEGCLLETLSRACASYCEAGGVFAALIDGDADGDRYGQLYVRVSEIAIQCDAAKA